MEFIETSIFVKAAKTLMDDHELRQLQSALCVSPALGPVIPGSGGLRKVRWIGLGKGKRGGVRVIYYLMTTECKIYFLYIYAKAQQDDLTVEQLKILKRLLEDI